MNDNSRQHCTAKFHYCSLRETIITPVLWHQYPETAVNWELSANES